MSLLRRSKGAKPAASPDEANIVPIADARARTPIRVRGQITRMRARPTSGLPTLAVSLGDGTGTVTAVFTGRRAIGGITLGRTIIIEGVAVQQGDHLEFTNPQYTLCN